MFQKINMFVDIKNSLSNEIISLDIDHGLMFNLTTKDLYEIVGDEYDLYEDEICILYLNKKIIPNDTLCFDIFHNFEYAKLSVTPIIKSGFNSVIEKDLRTQIISLIEEKSRKKARRRERKNKCDEKNKLIEFENELKVVENTPENNITKSKMENILSQLKK